METIVEFRAGQMRLQDGKLAPDTRKGLIRVCQDEAGLVHFCWFERDASGAAVGQPETDLVIIPGECTFGKIPRPGSRVFELRFPEEKHRNLFFWAQQASPDSDDDYVAAINLALNQGEGSADEADEAEGMDTEAPPGAAGASSAPAPAGAAAAPPAPAAAAAGAGGIAASDLAAILGSIMSGGAVQQAAAAQRQRAAVDLGPSLSDVLRPELVAPLLQSSDMVERLAPYLPEEHRSAAAISELVSTPQFRHQLELFSHALMTGHLDTAQFGLPPGGFGVLDFLNSIQAQADGKQQQQGQGQGGSGGAASGEGAPQ